MIIAIDFDGVLVEDKFPDIGQPIQEIIDLVKEINPNHETILWTCRINDRLLEAIQWCDEHDLHFTTINANTPSNLSMYGTDPRKIYADFYIDDRMINYSKQDTIKFLQQLTKEEKNVK